MNLATLTLKLIYLIVSARWKPFPEGCKVPLSTAVVGKLLPESWLGLVTGLSGIVACMHPVCVHRCGIASLFS